jgi:acylphosphatase
MLLPRFAFRQVVLAGQTAGAEQDAFFDHSIFWLAGRDAKRLLGAAHSCAMLARMRTVRLIIAGSVQGVGYRAWATRFASELGLRGWVRNRADGTVEILATGAHAAVAAMVEAARHGPRAARVSTIEVHGDQDDGSTGFGALPTE